MTPFKFFIVLFRYLYAGSTHGNDSVNEGLTEQYILPEQECVIDSESSRDSDDEIGSSQETNLSKRNMFYRLVSNFFLGSRVESKKSTYSFVSQDDRDTSIATNETKSAIGSDETTRKNEHKKTYTQ
ncbi:hypothetical protein EDEG_02236 [Edhazardia aedis USNM 41457]|uniref:Uncharacterized protein n=1 Tax=Edhazardia aedis (strain USNM 41457) TaxID=1003232 RepID=J9D6J4_EDHAE|nr:hypothetical protein EDEG_02236 [Edhazardia aedis USNM 41457]|eukprot:EJW03416.1 hypothetical protein EDEG_02236 [Edhazardia aedis USNM 41457]